MSLRPLLVVLLLLQGWSVEAREGVELGALTRWLFSRPARPVLDRLAQRLATGRLVLRERSQLGVGPSPIALLYPRHPEVRRLLTARSFLEALDDVTDPGTMVLDTEAARRRLGPSLDDVLDGYARRGPARDPDVDRRIAWTLDTFSRAHVAWRMARGRPPRQMKSFWNLVPEPLARDGHPLVGFDLLARQHLLGTTRELLEAYEASGIAYPGMYVQGKLDSQEPTVMQDLRGRGVHVLLGTEQRLANAQDALEQFFANWTREKGMESPHSPFLNAGHSLLIVDDGGDTILRANELLKRLPPGAPRPRIVAVEQTRSGANKLRGVPLLFPVINVAESWAKLTYESVLIGRSTARSIDAEARRLRRAGVPLEKRVRVIGFGRVGKATARQLARLGYTVEVHDRDPNALAVAHFEGFETIAHLDDALERGGLIAFATGEVVLDDQNVHRVKPGSVLFNLGSGTTEFGFDAARLAAAQPGAHPVFQGRRLRSDPSRAPPDRVLETRRGQVLQVRAGSVVNFGGEDPIPARYIQLTRGLLYLASLQAARERRVGLQDLDRPTQEGWVAAVEAELAETGESLLEPRF